MVGKCAYDLRVIVGNFYFCFFFFRSGNCFSASEDLLSTSLMCATSLSVLHESF